MTGKIDDCPLEQILESNLSICDELSPCEGFKGLYEKLDDDAAIEVFSPTNINPPSIFDLVQSTILGTSQEKVISISPVNLVIINKLSDEIFVKAVNMVKQGVIESSFIISSENPLLDQVEIKLVSFDIAQGLFNLEINSCDKLEALLHRHVESLHETLAHSGACFKMERVEINGKQIHRKKERIDGSTNKKVDKAK